MQSSTKKVVAILSVVVVFFITAIVMANKERRDWAQADGWTHPPMHEPTTVRATSPPEVTATVRAAPEITPTPIPTLAVDFFGDAD